MSKFQSSSPVSYTIDPQSKTPERMIASESGAVKTKHNDAVGIQYQQLWKDLRCWNCIVDQLIAGGIQRA